VSAAPPPGRVLIGGVGYRWQGDASFGLVATDILATLAWPPGVDVADLGYGALLITQDLLDASPRYRRLIVLAAVARGRAPGLYPRRWDAPVGDPDDVQARIREAGAGVIDVEHLLVVAQHFNALPDDVLVLEMEPACDAPGEAMSAEATALLSRAVALARAEALAPSRRDGVAREPA
jgi:hydrogenase maturation protease